MFRSVVMAAAWLICAGAPLAAPTLTPAQLEALALRSPNVFDTFFKYQKIQEDRLPRFMFEGEAVVGPEFEIPVEGVAIPAHVAGGQMSVGTVPWTWGERAGLRFGADMYSTNLTPAGDANADGWGYRGALFYGSAFDRNAGWAVSLGAYIRVRPVTAIVNGERVFSTIVDTGFDDEGAGWRTGSAGGVKTTEVDSTQGFVHGTIPWIGVTTGFLYDNGGVRNLKGDLNLLPADRPESVGVLFGTIPQFRNYQAGLHASRWKPTEHPLSVSAEATVRKERGAKIDFDHALITTELTLFEDRPDRTRNHRSEGFTTDFHLKLEVGGSYHRLPGATAYAGWGGKLDLLSIGLGRAELRAGLGGGRNYYPDILMLPIVNVTTFRFIIGLAI